MCPNDEITVEVAKFVANIQCHMVETVKMNFRQEFLPNLICESYKANEYNPAPSEAEASEVDPRCENINFSEVFNRT